MCQSPSRRARNMLRLSLLLVLFTHRTPAYVTDSPSFADRLDKLYEKLDKFSITPDRQQQPSPQDLLAKIDKLNALRPDVERDLSDEDEELLSAIQMWGMLNNEQLEAMVKELQGMKEERNEKLTDAEYADGEWVDADLQEIEYPMDIPPEDGAGWDDVDLESSTMKATLVTPSAFTRLDNIQILNDEYNREVVSTVDPIAATNERPKILDSSNLTLKERTAVQQRAVSHITAMVRAGKCLVPQPRWLSVKQLAPAADTAYLPPCVQLHRCAHDSGCCNNNKEGELVCSPVEGEYITLPFYLSKANGSLTEARMVFYNHTRCGCVSRVKMQSATECNRAESRSSTPFRREVAVKEVREATRTLRDQTEGQTDWKSTEEPRLERDEEHTAPPQLRRCTCPGLFLAKMNDNGICSCVCYWSDLNKKRDCLSLARGREHFGLRDRVCVLNGDCNPPSCEYGAFERSNGRCPLRRFRRLRFHRGKVDKFVV